MGFRARLAAVAVVCGLVSVGAVAQATGDSRTVTEPTFPVSCAVLTAQQAIVNDAPASETTYDTSRIQAALTACASGQAVELAGGNGNYAFLSASLNIPTGVGLIVDGGVTLYASRKASDYQVSGSSETCGSYGANGNACTYFFTFAKGISNTGCGIYGYGVIDLRGGSTILDANGNDTGIKWWTNADTATTAGQSQDNVSLMKPNKSTNLVLYKITIRNSPQFHVVTSNVSGETVWGVKIQAPFTAHNTDGIDPQGTNVTINNTSISEGDDAIAVSGSSASSNISVLNTTVYSSHGVSIGSYTNAGVNNMLVKNVNMAGEPTDGNQNGIRIKSSLDRGGNVNNITYQNMCLRDIAKPLLITPVYNSNTGTSFPNYTNILLNNIHVLATTKATKYAVSVAGINGNYPTTMTLNNVVFDQAPTYSPAFSYATIALAGNVFPASLQSQAGTGVTYTGSATAAATPAYDCSATATVFPFVVGELFASTSTATNLQAASIASGAMVTLNAMVQPAKSQVTFNGTVGNYTGTASLTAAVNFYEGTTLVGTGALGANSTNNSLATLTLSGVTAGTHTYTARYPGDATYNALAFGSVTVTVAPPLATTTTLTAPANATYGVATTVMANVAPTAATGTVTFLDSGVSVGTGTLSAGVASTSVKLAYGTHSLTASYGGDGTYAASVSTVSSMLVCCGVSTLSLTVSPATITAYGSATVSVSVTGASGMAVPSGQVVITDDLGQTLTLGLTNGTNSASFTFSGVGTHHLSGTYGGDLNYNSSTANASLVVTAATSTTTLTASTPSGGATVYPGGHVGLGALVIVSGSTAVGSTVTFYQGSAVLGTGVVSSGGVASLSLNAPTALGPVSYTATVTAGANFATSTSAPTTVTVVAPWSVTAATPVSIAAGSSGTSAIVVTPGGGYFGSITATCTSPVSYVMCTPASSTVVFQTNTSPVVSTSVTIAVAATTGAVRESGHGLEWAAVFGLLGLCGVRSRRKFARVLAVVLMVGAAVGMSGCGGSTTGSGSGGSGSTKPTGSQTVTYTLINSAGTTSTPIVVNIQ